MANAEVAEGGGRPPFVEISNVRFAPLARGGGPGRVRMSPPRPLPLAGNSRRHRWLGSRRDGGAVGRVLGGASAALLFAVAITQPEVANADDGGGSHHGFGHFRAVFGFGGVFPSFFWWGYGYPFFPFYDNGYPDHRNYNYDPGSTYYGNYPGSGYGSQPNANARQTWYYCSDPAGYYPSVTHCNTVWQYGPGSANAAPPHGSHVGK